MKKIDTKTFKKMLINGSLKIADNAAYINELNVFPIPDGDTGTNMKITTSAAKNDIATVEKNDLYTLGKTFSRSLLMNARGNSGVIFSQIMNGFVSPFIENQEFIEMDEIPHCFRKAQEKAYSSVANPVEGTILTVIREVAEFLEKEDLSKYSNMQTLFKKILEVAKESLDKTPEKLEELKRVGVVDSGGYGLYSFLQGMYEAFNIDDTENDIINKTKNLANDEIKQKIKLAFDDHDNEEGFGYCSEIIMKVGARIDPSSKSKRKFDFNEFKQDLEKMGDSLVCVQDEDLVKVHLHTFEPGEFLNYSQQFGEFLKVKFENMTEQYYERMGYSGVDIIPENNFEKDIENLEDRQEIVITCPSLKIKKILNKDYDIKYIINTEKIGNPSIQDILLEVQKTKANKILFVTDDTNIVLAANQAKEIVKQNIDMKVIKGSNIFEALLAALEFDPLISFGQNEKNMNKAVQESHSAMISKAVKDVDYNHISIKKNDFIGIINKKIQVSDSDELIVLKSIVDQLVEKTDEPSILMIYYDSKKSLKVLKELEVYVAKKYDLMCEFKEGGQKVYNYLLGLQ